MWNLWWTHWDVVGPKINGHIKKYMVITLIQFQIEFLTAHSNRQLIWLYHCQTMYSYHCQTMYSYHWLIRLRLILINQSTLLSTQFRQYKYGPLVPSQPESRPTFLYASQTNIISCNILPSVEYLGITSQNINSSFLTVWSYKTLDIQ